MDANKHIERAEKEVGRKNFDLAISLFDQILAIDPDNGRARAGKRRAELKKHDRAYPSAGVLAIKNLPHKLAIGVGKLVRAHGMVAGQAEKALSNDPRNVGLNLSLGHALLKAGHKNGAEAAFAVVAEFDPNDVESLKTLGQLYYEGKKWDEALACYERVLKVSPRDQVAIKMRKNLAAEGAIKSGGFEKAASSRDLARSQQQLEELEQRQKIVKTADDVDAEVQQIRDKIADNSDDPELWKILGNLLVQKRDLAEAGKAFAEVVRLLPDDAEAATKLGDVKLMKLDEQLREAKKDMEDGEEGADDRVRRLKKERRTLRVEEFRRRVAAHPTDTSLRFKLGQYLLEDNELDDAIAELQLVVKDPRRKFQAMTLMGKAFLMKGMGDLAIKQLTQALEGTGGVNEKNLDVCYTLARAYEDEDRLDEALDQFTSIYEIDISYRDVGAKIEALRDRIKKEN